MSTKFILTRDINGYNGFGLPPADDNYTAKITVGAADDITVPSNFENWLAIFGIEPGANVWVAIDTTATVAAGATFAASASRLNPVATYVTAGQTISCITPDASANVSISLYALGNNS